MKVFNFCCDDWANFMHDNTGALRSVGCEVRELKRNPHPSYALIGEAGIGSMKDIRQAIQWSDVVQFFHDNMNLLGPLLQLIKGKRLIVYHTSSHYRLHHESIQYAIRPYVYASIAAMPEFVQWGGVNLHYVVGAVDTERLVPVNRLAKEPPLFGHYPSNTKVKGTEKIREMFRLAGAGITIDEKVVPYAQQLERMRGCDVYVELFSMMDSNGQAYGNFGITALEAAALGKIVMTNCLGKNVYEHTYGKLGLRVANTETEFISFVKYLKNATPLQLSYLQYATRQWVEKNHSYKATGERLLKIIK